MPRRDKQKLQRSLPGLRAAKDSARATLGHLNSQVELETYAGRFKWVMLVFSIPLLILVGRLWQLQVVEADDYARQARTNLVRTVELQAPRGLIYDRAGRVIAENRPGYDVMVTPRLVKLDDTALDRLGEVLNIPRAELAEIKERVANDDGRAFAARRDITRDQVALLESHRAYLPGIEVKARAQRYYPYNEHAAHLVGFMNEINGQEYEKLTPYGYKPGDYIGRMGIERRYEAVLRGSPGLVRQVVDARGIPQGDEDAEELLGHYRRVDPIPGRDLHLTVDMKLQEIMSDAFADHPSGAAVAIDPRDGSVLAMLSKPHFNPNSWTGRLSAEEKRRSDNDPFKPMIDKTTQSHFPGSTYKLVSALASVNEGYVQPDETLHCPGFYEYGNRRFHCWHRMGHGSVNLADSLKHSCDVFYYKLGERVGMDRLAQYAYMFGFGERTGIGINGETRGRVPTKDWHRKHSPEGFQYGFTLSTAVGQGDTRVTPLQLALAYASLANRGTLYYPRLVGRIASGERELFEYPGRIRHELEVPRETLDEIGIGMTAAVNEPGTSVHSHRLDYVTVAGKTGTAQVRGFESQRLVDGEVELRHRDHAWFASYAPADNPRITLVVFVEHGGSGGKVAAPIAMNILDRYFREIEGIDPEEQRALVAAARNRGPKRLRRPGAEREAATWKRPGRDDDAPLDDVYLFSNVGEDSDDADRLTPTPRPRRLIRRDPVAE